MSYRLIDANALNGVISNDDYEKVLNASCIFADLPNGLDGEHYNLQEPVIEQIRAEIEQTAIDYDKFDDYRRVRSLWIALEIIDKYRKGANE